MTYIIAWKDKNNIYVAGDTLLTTNAPTDNKADFVDSENEQSSVGESLITKDVEKKGKPYTVTMSEAILKIHNVDNKYIIGYAGTVEYALDWINMFRLHFSKQTNPTDNLLSYIKNELQYYVDHNIQAQESIKNTEIVINELQHCVGEDIEAQESIKEKKNFIADLQYCIDKNRQAQVAIKNTEIVVGFFEGDEPKLWCCKFDKEGKEHIQPNADIVCLGEESFVQNERLNEVVKQLGDFDKKLKDPQKILLQACSCMQVLLLGLSAYQEGIGGVFTGAYLDKSGFNWRKDTAIIFKETDEFVGVFHRENILFTFFFKKGDRIRTWKDIFQTLPKNKYRYRFVTTDEDIDKAKKLKKNLYILIRNFTFEFFAFLPWKKDFPLKMIFCEKEARRTWFKMKWELCAGNFKKIPVIYRGRDFKNELIEEAEFLIQFHWLPALLINYKRYLRKRAN